jgi:hypothetical protein
MSPVMSDLSQKLLSDVSLAQCVDLRADTLTEAMVEATRWVAAHDNDVVTVLAIRVDYYGDTDPDNSPVTITIIYQGCHLPCCEVSP